MFVNVFQNQIDKALTHFISNSNIAKENLAALEIRSQFAKTAILESGPSAENQAEQAATEAQIENARRLEAVFSSISAQDAQRIIDLQNQAVELEKQANLIDLMAEKEMEDSLNESRNFGAFTEQDLLTIDEAGKELEDISDVITNIYDEHQIVVESIELEYEAIKGMLQDYDEEKSQLADIEAIQSRINSIISKSDSELINQLGTQSKSLKNEKITADKKKENASDYNEPYFENESSNDVVTEYVSSYERPKPIKRHYPMVGEQTGSVLSDDKQPEESQTLKRIIAIIIGIVVVACVIFLGFAVLAIPVFLGLILKKK